MRADAGAADGCGRDDVGGLVEELVGRGATEVTGQADPGMHQVGDAKPFTGLAQRDRDTVRIAVRVCPAPGDLILVEDRRERRTGADLGPVIGGEGELPARDVGIGPVVAELVVEEPLEGVLPEQRVERGVVGDSMQTVELHAVTVVAPTGYPRTCPTSD